MRIQNKTDSQAVRLLTDDELNQVSGGTAGADARGRTFNPQPDPPGAIVMHNPPGC